MSYGPENSVVLGYEDRERRERISAALEAAEGPERSEYWDAELEDEVYPEREKLKCRKCGHVWQVAGTVRDRELGAFYLDNDDDEYCPVCEADDAIGEGLEYHEVRRR